MRSSSSSSSSSCVVVENCEISEKVRKRRKQKRDYASRKRQKDKDLLLSLEMTNRDLIRQKRHQKRQIEQLRAWATYAESYLNLCSQLATLQPYSQTTSSAYPPHPTENPKKTHHARGSLHHTDSDPPLEQTMDLEEKSEESQDLHSPGGSRYSGQTSPKLLGGSQVWDNLKCPEFLTKLESQELGDDRLPSRAITPKLLENNGVLLQVTTEAMPSHPWSLQASSSAQLNVASSVTTSFRDNYTEDGLCADYSIADRDSPPSGGMLQLLLADTPDIYSMDQMFLLTQDTDQPGLQDPHQCLLMS